MGKGPYCIFPSALAAENQGTAMLPIASQLRNRSKVITHQLSDSMMITMRVNGWDENDQEHEIEPIIRQALEGKRATIAVGFEEDRLNIACADKGKLLFVNTFRQETWQQEDVLYYILASCEHCKMDVAETDAIISERLRWNILEKYISNITWSK